MTECIGPVIFWSEVLSWLIRVYAIQASSIGTAWHSISS